MEELKLDEGNKELDSAILDILQRPHEKDRLPPNDLQQYDIDSNFDLEECDLDSDDDPEFQDITERLAGVNLDDAEQVWEKLTEDEKQDFVAFLK